MEDLKNWTSVLERLDTVLLEVGEKLNACNKLLSMEDDLNAKDTACKILKFLSLLLKASSDKRYFLSIEVLYAQKSLNFCCIDTNHSSPISFKSP